MLSWLITNCQKLILDAVDFLSIESNAAFTKLDSAISWCTTRQAYTSAANEQPQARLKAGVGQNWSDMLRPKPKLQRVLLTPLEIFH